MNLLNISETTQLSILKQLSGLVRFYRAWLKDSSIPMHIIKYENLIKDLRGEIIKMLGFLNYVVVESQVQCTLRHSEGNYHRKMHIPDTTEFFSPLQREMLHRYATEIEKLIDERNCLEDKLAIFKAKNNWFLVHNITLAENTLMATYPSM